MAPPAAPANLAQPLSQGVTAELYRAAIGPRAQDAYLRYFTHFDAQGRTSVTWHWPAYWCTLNWMLYRRLWGPAGIYLASVAGAALLVFGVGKLLFGYDTRTGLLLFMMFLGAAFVLPALYAHAWYYNHCQRQISAALREHEDVARACAALAEQARPTRRLLMLIGANAVLAVLAALLLGWALTPPTQVSAQAAPAASAAPASSAAPAALGASGPTLSDPPEPTASSPTAASATASPTEPPRSSLTPSPTASQTYPPTPSPTAAASAPVAPAPRPPASSAPAAASGPVAVASAAGGQLPTSSEAPVPHLTPAQIEARVSQALGATAAQQPVPQPRPEPAPAAAPLVASPLAAASRPARAASGAAAAPGVAASAGAVASPRGAASAASTASAASAASAGGAASGTRPGVALPRPAQPLWFVQVGVFAEEANAENARAKIASAGLQPSVAEQGRAARRLLRVRVGPFATRAEAENASLQVQALDLPAVVMLAPP